MSDGRQEGRIGIGFDRPIRILITAYACSPNRGSEPGNAWQWATHYAARGHEVLVITSSTMAGDFPAGGSAQPNLRFEFLGPPAVFGWLPGSAGSYGAYLGWQQVARRWARQHAKHNRVDVVHHITWSSLTWGTMITIPEVPLVFGPIGGGQVAPPLFKEYFGDGWRRERLRSAVVTHGLRFNPLTRATLKRAALVLATNSATRSRAMELGASRVELMLDTAVPMNMRPSPVTPQQPVAGAFTYLWVGRLIVLKGLQLALEAFEMAVVDADIKLRIVGDGPELAESRAWVSQHNLGDRVTFTGRLEWNEISGEYDRADAFLFSSLRDSSGAQVFEAVAFGLPVVTLDHNGVGEFLPDEASVKVPVTTPTETKYHLAAALAGLANDRESAKRKGDAATAFSREATWPAKVAIAETYLVALDAPSKPASETGTNSLLRKIRNTIVCQGFRW